MGEHTHADFHRQILHDINVERGQPERSYTPKDPTSSLVYADWLEEQGMPKAAAFIRRAAPADRATSIMHYPSTIPPASPTGFAVGVYQGVGEFRPRVGRRRPQPTLRVQLYAPHPEGKGALAWNIDVPVDEGNKAAEELLAEGHAPRNDGAEQRVKLARRTIDTKKHPEYWAFLNQLADKVDPTTARVFADWLSERRDPREHVARAVVGRYWFDNEGWYHRHPERPDGQVDRYVHHVPGEHPNLPLRAFSDNVHTAITLHRMMGEMGQNPLPVLRWSFHVPRTKSDTKTTKYGRMTAPVTVEQLHQFIDAMPHGETKAKWKEAARQHGWERPPVKLARVKIDPPSELERHAVAAMQNRKDPMALHVFADHVEENHPNSVWLPVIREMQAGGDWRAKVREAKKTYTAEKRHTPQSTPWTGAANVGGVYFHPELNEWRVGSGKKVVAPSHWWDENEAVDPDRVVDGKKTTMDRALHLLRNMPGGVDNVIGMALAAHFFAESRVENAKRLKLARLGPAVTGRTHTGETRYTHEFTDDEGKPLGTLSLVPREKALHVDWVGLHGAAAGEQAGAAGAKHIRSLLPQIAAAYPQHEILMGRRAGGAHRGELRGVELAPHRLKLARTGMIDSTNHRKRVELAKKVLSEAGFGRAVVKAALAHYGREQQPGVLAAIERATNPQHAVYTAAWIGMLTQQPRVSVFHPGDGEDALHVITSPHPTEHVSEYLRRAGVPRFSSERTATGTRAFVVDPDGQFNPAAWSAGLDGQHTTLRGKAHTLEGRGAYRKAIREAEEASDASNSGAE